MPRTEKSKQNIVKYCIAKMTGPEQEMMAYIDEFFTHIIKKEGIRERVDLTKGE